MFTTNIKPPGFLLVIAIIIGLVMIGKFAMFSTQYEKKVVRDCKVVKLQQQNIISGDNQSMKTDIRYLVITDKETFVCESSLLNGKFNNSDIFFRLKEDSTYTFQVCGIGKTAFTDYRNILDIVK